MQSSEDPHPVTAKPNGGRGRGRRTRQTSNQKPRKKTTCRTTGKKGTSIVNAGKRSKSLQDSRKAKCGISSSIDTEKYGRGKTC